MFRPGLVVGLLVAVGLIFIGQGIGLLRSSSFMVGDNRWAWIGSAFVLAGVGLGFLASRRNRA